MIVDGPLPKEIDESFEIMFEGDLLTLEDISILTGMSLEIMIRRAKRCPTEAYVFGEKRSVSTYPLEGFYYTIPELSFMFGVYPATFFELLVNCKLNVEAALTVIEGHELSDGTIPF